MSPAENRSTKRRKINYRDTITVLVGKNEDKFTIHEDAITRISDFFQAACSGQFKEAGEKIVRLPEMCSEIFEAYIQWVYSGMVVITEDEEALIAAGKVSNVLVCLANLYIAGDVLGDLRLRNACIDRIITTSEKHKTSTGPQSGIKAYNSTTDGSTLRKVVIDFYLAGSFAAKFKEASEDFPRAFLIDLVYGRMVNNNERTLKPSGAEKCKYHEHNEDVPRCSISKTAK